MAMHSDNQRGKGGQRVQTAGASMQQHAAHTARVMPLPPPAGVHTHCPHPLTAAGRLPL